MIAGYRPDNAITINNLWAFQVESGDAYGAKINKLDTFISIIQSNQHQNYLLGGDWMSRYRGIYYKVSKQYIYFLIGIIGRLPKLLCRRIFCYLRFDMCSLRANRGNPRAGHRSPFTRPLSSEQHHL